MWLPCPSQERLSPFSLRNLYKQKYTIVYLMETVTAKLTSRLTHEVDSLIEAGWYANRSEAIRDALRDFVERNRLRRLESAIEEDIAWGKERE